MSPTHAAWSRKRLARGIGILALRSLLVIGLGELVALGVAKMRLGEDYSTIALTKQEFLRFVPQSAGEEETPAEPFRLNIRREHSPYFGFTYERAGHERTINNYGFREDVDFPYQPLADELVVGVFGGSVALDLRRPGPERALKRELAEALSSRGYREVTLLVLAQGGWRQPQPFFCFLYFLDSLDMAIFLDGFNEIGQLPLQDGRDARSYPWSFPAPQVYERLRKRAQTVEDLLRERQIEEVRKRQLRFTKLLSRGLLGRSMMAHLVWRAYNVRLEREVASHQERLAGARGIGIENVYPADADFDAMLAAYFDQYESWLEIAHMAGMARRKPVFHFVQPNQYVPGSKPLSDLERKVVVSREDFRRAVEAHYPSLRSMSERLRGRGVPSFDLSTIFANTHETMYTDSCCHMSEAGMERVAIEIASAVRASPLLQSIPRAPERELPLGPRLPGTKARGAAATWGPSSENRQLRTLQAAPGKGLRPDDDAAEEPPVNRAEDEEGGEAREEPRDAPPLPR